MPVPAVAAVAGDVGQHAVAGVACRCAAIDEAIAGGNAQEDLTAGQGIAHVGVRADFHLALGLVTAIDNFAVNLGERRIAVVGTTEHVAPGAIAAVGQRQQTVADLVQLGDQGLLVRRTQGGIAGLDGQIVDACHQVVDLGEGVFLHAQAVLHVVAV
ncbi:hypothetical protein D3C73_1196730 [compost metagenome]